MMKDFVRQDALVSHVAETVVSTPSPRTFNDVASHTVGSDANTGWYQQWGKRVLDLALVLLSLPITLPVIAMSAAALWLESGPPLYWQDRLGRGGKRFRIMKLRTMVRDADAQLEHLLATDPDLRAEWDETQKLKDDPRITKVGAFLRVTSMDELPQLWNVLVGDMTLVGPRPMLPEQLSLYGDARAYYALRPGLTGTWQVLARNDKAFETRRAFDAAYRAQHDLREDLVLLWRTVGVVMRRTGY